MLEAPLVSSSPSEVLFELLCIESNGVLDERASGLVAADNTLNRSIVERSIADGAAKRLDDGGDTDALRELQNLSHVVDSGATPLVNEASRKSFRVGTESEELFLEYDPAG